MSGPKTITMRDMQIETVMVTAPDPKAGFAVEVDGRTVRASVTTPLDERIARKMERLLDAQFAEALGLPARVEDFRQSGTGGSAHV